MSLPLFILGATATGKSEVALELARQSGASILVMDAMQVYRGLNIGVGKPTAEEQRRIPHSGIDWVDWTETFDVARYLHFAGNFLTATRQPVIVCGGTGLYFQALTQGLCDIPAAAPALRVELSQLSLTELQDRLRQADPEICDRLDMQNPRRVQRALECLVTTGRSLLAWQRETPPPLVPSFRAVWLQRPLEELRRRIGQRVDGMLENGWCAEVEQLLPRGGEEKLAQCPAIGYKELMDVCQDRLPLEEARGSIVIKTGQYAKRQITWLNRSQGVTPWVMSDSLDDTCQNVWRIWHATE